MSDITIEKTAEDSASKSLRVTVPTDRIRAAEAKAVRYYAERARLPGFRPGKAPDAVVRKRFGDAIRQTVLEEVIRESWETVQTSQSLKPIAGPSISNVRFEEGSPLQFDLQVEVRPEIALDRLGGFTLARPAVQVTEAQVDEQLHRLREAKASWLPIDGAKPAPGQLVRVEVAPIDDQGAVGQANPYELVLGQHQAIPELEERIMQLTPGESADADVRFPDDHPDPSRRGQTRRVRVTLYEVKQQELPALDDALAREVGDFDSLDALRATVREDLERDAGREADSAVRQQLVEQLAQANNVKAPESLVHRVLHAYANAYQVAEERLPEFEQQFHAIAEAQVRRDLVLEAVVERHELRATEAEIDARVAQLAERRGVPAGQVYTELQKHNRLGELERGITEEKVFAFLLPKSTIDESAA